MRAARSTSRASCRLLLLLLLLVMGPALLMRRPATADMLLA
jgi:hypothetical protein